jgi:hypothetical protein
MYRAGPAVLRYDAGGYGVGIQPSSGKAITVSPGAAAATLSF